MDGWMRWVVVILVVAGILALVTYARGVPGRHELIEAAIVRDVGTL
jgi:hypothetical protein